MAPLPSDVVITGACRYSASRVSAADAASEFAPPPAQMTTLPSDSASSRAASAIWSEGGSEGECMAGSSSSMSSASASVSGGISTSTGRGRPVLSCRKASCTADGTSPAFTTRAAHLVTDFTASSWSSISCSIPRFTPMRSRGICPATSSTGDEAECRP